MYLQIHTIMVGPIFFSLVQIQNRLHRAFFKYSDRNLAAANVEIFRDVGILTHPVFLCSLSQACSSLSLG